MPPRSICAPCSARVCSSCSPGASRGIQLRDSLREQMGLPLIGRVAAGRPILAEENIEARYQVDPQLFSAAAALPAQGPRHEHADVGILDGDLVAVHRTPEVRNRQIVVARLENEVTVKRYRQDGTVVWLHAGERRFRAHARRSQGGVADHRRRRGRCAAAGCRARLTRSDRSSNVTSLHRCCPRRHVLVRRIAAASASLARARSATASAAATRAADGFSGARSLSAGRRLATTRADRDPRPIVTASVNCSLLMPALAALCRQTAATAGSHDESPTAGSPGFHRLTSRMRLRSPPAASMSAACSSYVREPALWAMEQALRSGACSAVLGWAAPCELQALRRLQLAAEQSRCLAVLFRRQRDANVAFAGGAANRSAVRAIETVSRCASSRAAADARHA